MNLHEVKIGDSVTFTTEKGKKVKGKVIHRHNDASKAHLMGHVNVQLDDEGSYPQTVHVSKLKKITEETIMDSEYISEEEFEALSPEEQADYEMVQLDEVGPDGRRNRILRDKIGSTDPLRPWFRGPVGDGPKRRDDSLTSQRASNKRKDRDELATGARPQGRPGSVRHTHELKYILKTRNTNYDGSKNTKKTGPNPNFQKMNATAKKLRKEEVENTIPHFLQAVLSGENIEANTILDGLMAEKIDAALSALKVDVAQHMFATESVEHSEYISEEEFNALSPEQQAEYEMVELEEAGPVKTANKAKKGNWEYNAAQKAVKTGDLQKSNTDSPNPLKADFRSLRKDTPTSLVKHYRKGASSTDKTYAQHSKKQHASEVKRPVAYGKRANFVKMNATAKSLNKEQFAVDEAIIAPRPTPSPAATAAAKTDIEKAKKKREDALAAAKAELASTSKGDLKKALYSKMYKNEEVEQVNEVITKSTPTSEIISDFVHSKNSKFTGKNKKERIKMALGAKYAMMKKD